MARYDTADAVDAVVIGTGAGGAPILARLAQAGRTVVALEAGRNWMPSQHTADETAASSIYWLDERLSGGTMPPAFGGNNSGTGVGGSMLHWGAFCPRPDPRDFRLHSLTGKGHDWPFETAELTPWYQELERYLGVSGSASYPWDAGRHYLLPPVMRNAPADAMARGCAAVGITATDGPVAVVTRDWQQAHWGLRQACVNCGCCHQGCRNGAKTSMDTSFLPLAVAHGAEIRPGCMVHGMQRDAAGRITAVAYRENGIDRYQRCRAVFLCAGGVESPRLLLNLGLANSSGQVGRNFMAHVATQVWGRFDADMRMNRGYPSAMISEDMMWPDGAAFAGGYLMQSLGVLPIAFANTLARGGAWGARLADMLDGYNQLGGIGVNGECLPSSGNRLYLSDEVDRAGLRKARIDFGYGDNETAMDRHAQATMRRIWAAAGAKDVFVLPRSAHTIGTCRMGADPRAAVVDPSGRSHDIGNLWIADNSVFPSAVAANPALTIMALALRTADHFLQAGA